LAHGNQQGLHVDEMQGQQKSSWEMVNYLASYSP
jgi:hypothetical protein